MARGMSLRALAKELNLSGHGTLVDYEHGRRIPPENLVEGCERVFEISDGSLRNLREKALAERANRVADEMLRPPEPEPDKKAEPPPVTRRLRVWPWAVIGAVVVTAGVWIGVWRLNQPSAPPAPPVKFGFEDGTQRWSPQWGGKRMTFQATSLVAYEGHQSLQITTTAFSNVEDKAIGVTHGIETLHPGMKVTFHLRVPGQQNASIRFFVYDSKSKLQWAPESPGDGHELALPTNTDWKEYVWTVPQVDVVHAIGMEVYQFTDQPVTIWIDAVNW